jgi:hypothetical protein
MFETTFSLHTNSGTYVNVACKNKTRSYNYLLLQLHAGTPDPSYDPADKNKERCVFENCVESELDHDDRTTNWVSVYVFTNVPAYVLRLYSPFDRLLLLFL